MAEQITSAKKCRRDTMILLFTSAIVSAFAECRRELERLPGNVFFLLILFLFPRNSFEQS